MNELMTVNKLMNKEISNELLKAIGNNNKLQLFIRCAQTEIRKNPKLLQCEARSVLGAIFSAAQLHLSFSGLGQAYLVPYWNKTKNVMECQFQIGYRGFIDLFYRHQSSFMIEAGVVKEGDDFDFQLGTEKYIKHKWGKERGNLTDVYAIATIRNEKTFVVLSKKDVDEVKKLYAKTTNIWDKHYDVMAMKTAVKRLCKFLPLSVDMQMDISLDETTRYYQPEIADPNTEPDRTDFDEIESGDETIPEDAPKKITEKKHNITKQDYDNFLSEMTAISEKVGQEKFYALLGQVGYEKVKDLRTQPKEEMDRVIREINNNIDTQL